MKMMHTIRLGLVIMTAGLFAGCAKECNSPVDPNKTVRVRGHALPPATLVAMFNPSGMADRTATVDGSGRYEFPWTGSDLTGFWGERSFYLQVPAERNEGEAWVTSQKFVLRRDMEAPALAVWSPAVVVETLSDGGLRVRFDELRGEHFQPIGEYVVRLYFRKINIDSQGKKFEQDESATRPVRPGENVIAPAELKQLMPGRIKDSVQVGVDARGHGAPLALTYHAGRVRVEMRIN